MAEVEMRSLGIHCHKVIDSGVDTEFFKPRAKDDLRIKYGLSADRTVACWVGGSHPIKGIGVVSELISRFPDIDWILVFRDLSGKDLAAPRIPATLTVTIHKRGIALTVHRRGMPASLACLKKTIHKDERRIFNKRRIIILGKLQPQQLNEIYCLSDFAVLPYLCEGSNYVVLEACSCNLPIVTTRTGLFWDFWDDRIGVPIDKSRDVKEYSNAISKLMNHIETFEPRKVVLEQELNLESWADTWVKYLTSVR
jgi:glycosyltransferase involved in cell wall biosynthesis